MADRKAPEELSPVGQRAELIRGGMSYKDAQEAIMSGTAEEKIKEQRAQQVEKKEEKEKSDIEKFQEETGIYEPEAAQATLERYKENPQSEEFKNLSAPDIQKLNIATGQRPTANLVEVGKGQFISPTELERIDKLDPIGAQILKDAGVEAYGERVKELNARPVTREQETETTMHYTINGEPISEEEYYQYLVQKKNLDDLRRQGYATMLAEYPEGGAPFESYETTPSYNLAKYLKDNRANLDSAILKLKDAGFTDEQIQDARLTAFRAPSELLPDTGESEPFTWSEELATNLAAWQEGLKPISREEAKSETEYTLSTIGAAGASVGATLVLAPVMIGLSLINEKGNVIKVGGEVIGGMAAQVGNTAQRVASGYYTRQAEEGNLFPFVYDTILTGLILKGGKDIAKPALSEVVTYLHPRGTPLSVIAKEVSTGRIKTPEDFAEAYAQAINKAEQLATQKGGSFTGEVPIEGTPYSLRYLKTPMEQVTGDVLFHGTKTEGTKLSTLKMWETGKAKEAPAEGLYTSPWAAIGYARGGVDPGIAMIITDSTKLKSGAKGLSKGLTQSDKYIRGADKGFYGSSKVWRGDLETEIVAAPGTEFNVPAPTADLFTRMTSGSYADFFTYDSGKFVPIKIAIDAKNFNPKVVETVKSPSSLYAVKLYSLYNALRDTTEAVKRPDLVLKDVSGTIKELFNLDRYVREGTAKGGNITFPGVRDIYLKTNVARWLRDMARDLYDRAFRKTKNENPSLLESSIEFQRRLERNMSDIYRANADSLIRAYNTAALAYSGKSGRSKFEKSYLGHVSMSTEALVKSSESALDTLDRVTSDVIERYPLTERAIEYLESVRETPSEAISEREEPSEIIREITSEYTETPDIIRTPDTVETTEITPPTPPEEPRTTDRPRTPSTPSPPYIGIARLQSNSPTSQPIPPGSIAWRQGSRKGTRGMLVPQWFYIPPPFDQQKPIAIPYPPTGALNVGATTPKETIQIIGRSRRGVPRLVNIDLGFVDVSIENGNKIVFNAGGTRTNIGTMLASNTKGMSIENGLLEEYPVFRATKKSTVKKTRPTKRNKESWLDNLTSLRGFRP